MKWLGIDVVVQGENIMQHHGRVHLTLCILLSVACGDDDAGASDEATSQGAGSADTGGAGKAEAGDEATTGGARTSEETTTSGTGTGETGTASSETSSAASSDSTTSMVSGAASDDAASSDDISEDCMICIIENCEAELSACEAQTPEQSNCECWLECGEVVGDENGCEMQCGEASAQYGTLQDCAGSACAAACEK